MSHCVLDPERRLASLGVKVPESQVDVRPQPLHALDGQGAAQVLCVGPGRGQPEAVAVHGPGRCLVHVFQHVAQGVVLHQGVVGLVGRREGVHHHPVQLVLGDAAPSVGDPAKQGQDLGLVGLRTGVFFAVFFILSF